jgi:hypothetical protein
MFYAAGLAAGGYSEKWFGEAGKPVKTIWLKAK